MKLLCYHLSSPLLNCNWVLCVSKVYPMRHGSRANCPIIWTPQGKKTIQLSNTVLSGAEERVAEERPGWNFQIF